MSQSVAALPALVFCCALVTVGAQSDSVQVSRSGRGAYEASLAAHPLGFAVAWHDTRHGVSEIYARLVDGSGRPVSDEYRLTADAGPFVRAEHRRARSGNLRRPHRGVVR